jgi:AcrR family transcriptional regulator
MPIQSLMTPRSAISGRERVRNALREALLEAAEQVFAEEGFEGATMAAIAARAGYSAGHLYNVFENKEALFREVFRSRASLAIDQLSAALEGGRTLARSIDLFVRASLSFFEEHRSFFVFYIQTTSGFAWNVRRFGDEGPRVRRTLEDRIERHIGKAIERGELPDGDPLVYTCTLMGTLHHYLVRWLQSGGTSEDLWARESTLCAALHRLLGVAT